MAGVRAGSRWPHLTPIAGGPDNFIFGRYLPYPFFMGYAATYAAAKTGAKVTFRDSIALSESYESYLRFLDENRFDVILIESATPSWEHDGQLIRTIHSRHPNTRIVLTGPITSDAVNLMKDFPVHACIRGEYEKGSVKVIEGAEGIIDFDLLTKEEMNAAPFPHFDHTCAHRYWDANPIGQVPPHAQVWSSRGCPYKCIFCVWPATMTGNDPDGTRTRTVRHYSADYMEAFLTELVERYKYKTIYFDDDTFNLGNAHVERMCAVMSKLRLPWSAMCRADTIKMDNWRLMKEAGCFGVKLGFESGNQYVVDKIVNKHLNLDRAREVVYELKRLGLTVHGTFTIGLPGETPAQMEDTKRFIASLPFDSHQLSGCAEIEGTPLHSLSERGELAKYEGAKLDENYVRQSDGGQKYRSMLAGETTKDRGQVRHFIY
jgi:radical SAM superfamily enzyme YgiQ (UPF0313 family)